MGSRGRKDFKRRGPSRRAAKTIHIFCEGSKTEPDYFRAIEEKSYPRQVYAKPVGGLGSPEELVRKAIAAKKRNSNKYEENDQYWVVFDRDDRASYESAKSECEKKGINYAYSDPCFELWLILHFQDHDAPSKGVDLQRKVAGLLSGYDRKSGKTTDFSELRQHLLDAEQRAERQRQRRRVEGNADGNPSTSVYELTRLLR